MLGAVSPLVCVDTGPRTDTHGQHSPGRGSFEMQEARKKTVRFTTKRIRGPGCWEERGEGSPRGLEEGD